jgi:hypothetical protein
VHKIQKPRPQLRLKGADRIHKAAQRRDPGGRLPFIKPPLDKLVDDDADVLAREGAERVKRADPKPLHGLAA